MQCIAVSMPLTSTIVNIDSGRLPYYALRMADTPTTTATIEIPLVDRLQACCTSLVGEAIPQADAVIAASVFKALADPARVRLISMIAKAGPEGACVCDLNEALDLAQPTVSHHLKVLLEAGLVERERRASWAYYRTRPGALEGIARILSA